MQIVRTIAELREARSRMSGRIGFVPTMGALHAGHERLIRQSVQENDATVVSIFVNPLQFGPQEDFDRYPRTEKEDVSLCEAAGVDLVFMPPVSAMYPDQPLVRVTVDPRLSGALCGAHRPGHFDGVAQAVTILFNLVRPTHAYFGEKDYQQLLIIKRLVADLSFDTTIVAVATVREPDGLALSSRNRYLSPEERAKAPGLYRALLFCKERAEQARFDRIALPIEKLEEEGRQFLLKEIPHAHIEYFEIRHADTLERTRFVMNRSRLFAAIHLGTTRLIDNIALFDHTP